MLGYKFINIKIQIALIKQIIYSYLFNLFITSPNFFVKPILTNFSKDSLQINSKEQFENFINNNKILFDSFYNNLSIKTRKYMLLATVLNKDMKTNFNNLSDVEIQEIGERELKDIFFDVFFNFIFQVKEKFDIDIDALKDSKEGQKGEKQNFKSSIEDLFKIGSSIPTFDPENDSVLIPYIKSNLFYPIINEKEIQKLYQKVHEGLGNFNGISGEFYYKIKEKLDIQLDCGNSSKKDIIIFSIRDLLNNKDDKEFLAVQQFFDWKIDDTYRNIEQFLFIRNPQILEKIKFEKNGVYTFNNSYNSIDLSGAKILNKKEILELKDFLKQSGNNSGFLAIIPNKTIKDEDVKKINEFLQNLDNNKKLYLSVFSEKERKSKMSINDVIELLGRKKQEPFNRTIFYKFSNSGFNINELFDLYFGVYSNKIDIKQYAESNISKQKIFQIENMDNVFKNNLENFLNKEGKYLLYVKEIQDTFSKVQPNITNYLILNRKEIINIKLSDSNEKKINVNGVLIKQFIPDDMPMNPYGMQAVNIANSQYIQNNFYNKFMSIVEKQEFKFLIDSLFPSDILAQSVIEKLDFGTFNEQILDTAKDLRSYKNYNDFLEYYINTVESLAREATDRV